MRKLGPQSPRAAQPSMPESCDSIHGTFPGRHKGYASQAQVWLIRHGEVDPAWQGKAYGALDVPLSAHGRAETSSVARRFQATRPVHVVASPLVRARTLGALLAADAGLELCIEPGLKEIERGAWQGLDTAELFARYEKQVAGFYGDPWSFRQHGGETDSDLLARAWPAFERALVTHGRPGATILLAAHYNVIRVLVARALGIAPTRSFGLRIDPLGAVLLSDGPKGLELAAANVKGPPETSTRSGAAR